MLSLFKKWMSVQPPVQPLPAVTVTDEEIPRYPPFAKGLPAAAVDRILATQAELIEAIRHTLALPGTDYRTIAWPVIERFAAYSHLLPASEAHHHRGAGGLFRHGLEVAHWALLASEGVMFEPAATPYERKQREPKWRLAVCLAGLLHDIGKPVSDLSVVDRSGSTAWNPYLENLSDWADKNDVDHYFLRWRDKRHQRHEQFSVLVTERVLTTDCLSYLTQQGPEIMQAMLEAIAGVDRGAMFHTLVLDADRKSVERDLKANHIQTDASLGVPVEKYLLDAMRRLVNSGRWSANTKGARIWRFDSGLYVVWKAGAQDVIELLAKDKVAGIPRDADTLADILLERGLAIPQQTADGRNQRYWRMLPADLGTALYMLRVATPDLLYSGEPPVIVEGESVPENTPAKGNAPGSVTVAVPDSATALLPPVSAAPPPTASVADTNPSTPSETPPEPESSEAQAGPSDPRRKRKESRSKPPSPPGCPPDTASHKDSQAIPAEQGSEPPAAQRPSDAVAKDANEAQVKATAWLRAKGEAGEWLLALVASLDQKTGAGRIRVLDDGRLFLPHPGAARRIGKEPEDLLRLLDDASWIETDIKAPLLKVRVIDGVGGVVLKREVARVWEMLIASPSGSENQVRDQRPRPSPPRSSPPAEEPDAPPSETPRPQVKSTPVGPGAGGPKPDGPSKPKQPGYPPADDLIRQIQRRESLPFVVTDAGDWLTVPYGILDWYIQLHPGVVRAQLIIGLHRHPQAQLDGQVSVRVLRKEPMS
ncbi:MAG: hypothetical protein FIA97_15830 [Methylococcaceae bacterium]|nr:hypothetical protein [Methylococcaceae bacterium]